MIHAVTASSKRDKAGGSVVGSVATLLVCQCQTVSVNACRKAFLGHLLQPRILLTSFLVVASDKDREIFSWLFEPHVKWDAVLGSLRVTVRGC